jgi:hypothetical protein
MSIWIADGTQFFKCRLYFFNLNKFSQRYIANMIGAACNSRIRLANLNAELNFVNANNCSYYIIQKVISFCSSAKTHRKMSCSH